jgi:flagellar export protein FliJ
MEEEKIRGLAQAKGRLLEFEEALKTHAETEGVFLEMYGQFEKETGNFDSDQVMAYCDYQEWLLSREREYRHREREWSEEVEKRRQQTVQAARARMLLENLREKKMRAHDAEVRVEEQKFLDEISSIAFVRRERSKSESWANESINLRR